MQNTAPDRLAASHPLDNVIWNALTSRLADFAQSAPHARRFLPEVGPLAGFAAPTDAAFASLAQLAGDGPIAIFQPEAFEERKGWTVVAGAPLLQMVWQGPEPQADMSIALTPLGLADSADMQALAALTRPGPFGPRTHELGSYFGVRIDGALAAMAGERMRVDGYTEVSAVCTHPDHVGRGYAARLMTEVMKVIRARGETPFLHSRADNDRAIGLYEKLGFRPRQQGHFVVLARQ